MYESFLIPFRRIQFSAYGGYDQFSFVISGFLSLIILSDLVNEQDETFSDAVSQTQIKPTTVTSSYL